MQTIETAAPFVTARPRARYLALIRSVQEVSLSGAADAGFWLRQLRAEKLEPACLADGSAHVLLLGAEMKWNFQVFREASISVAVRVPGESMTGFYLLHAFNTNPWFAWCERTIFSTPFTREECRLTVESPLRFSVGSETSPLLDAAMSAAPRPPSQPVEPHWEGSVFLPRPGSNGPRKFFYGLIAGHGHSWDFQPGDKFALDPQSSPPALRLLTESGFTPRQWMLRLNATHGKSRTHRRT